MIKKIKNLLSFIISRSFYFVLGIFLVLGMYSAYAVWSDTVNPDDLLTADFWNEHVNKLIDLDNRINSILSPGAVMAFNLASCPAGWSAADGGGTPARPDLRGVFIRGLDNGRGLDPGRTFGSYQEDDFENHTHGGRTMDASQGWCPRAGCGDYGGVSAMAFVGGSETRPINVALIYCVKD